MPESKKMTLKQIIACGEKLFNEENYTAAADIFTQLLAQQADNGIALHFMAVIMHKKKQQKLCYDYFNKALKQLPNSANLHYNYASALCTFNDKEKACTHYKQSIALKENYKAYYHLSLIYHAEMKFSAAKKALTQCLALRNHCTDAHIMLGNIARLERDIKASVNHYREAIHIEPNNAIAHWNLAISLLLLDNYEAGWIEFDWRWLVPSHKKYIRKFDAPLWDGNTTQGKTLLIYCEQGLGDAIQFFRYVELVKQKELQVILQCGPSLKKIFQNSSSHIDIYTLEETLPQFDFYIPLLSLPGIFKTTIANIPKKTPYLFPKENLSSMDSKICHKNTKPRIGITWFGNKNQAENIHRSCPLEIFSQLFENDYNFIVIQKKCSQHDRIILDQYDNVSLSYFEDFNDTASLLLHLDLAISVCSAPLHLAAALGIQTWGLLHFCSDWRWGLEREQSPWYPTVRLFRQKKLGEWQTVINDVQQALRETFV